MNRLERIEHAAQHTLLDVKGYPVVEDIRALIRVARAAADAQALCALQAEDATLWSIPFEKPQPIYEVYFQQELRKLHAAVEAIPLAPLLESV